MEKSIPPPYQLEANRQNLQVSSSTTHKRYNCFDGLRSYSALWIVAMHVFENMPISSMRPLTISDDIIAFGAQFVFLFMMISGFSMCCGYYDRVKYNQISMNDFFKRRYQRVWPFFALLTILDLVMTHSLNGLYEAFANLTLSFNLLPSPDIKCIGVGWFLGTIFLFYMLFPFYVFLLDNKIRAWFVLPIAILFNIIANNYFFHEPFVTNLFYNGWANMINCAPYFVLGGLVFLYKDDIHNWINWHKWFSGIALIIIIIAFSAVYRNDESSEMFLLKATLFALICCYALIDKNIILSNKVVKYLSGISMEIYLCHMVMFRIVECLGLSNLTLNTSLNYVLAVVITIVLAIIFSHVTKYWFLPNLQKRISKSITKNI